MEVGQQIRKYRNELGISQDELAEKIYVTRQTISNWENGKNYPDVNSLLRLSEVFDISLDRLIKGDIDMMREEISEDEVRSFFTLGKIYTGLLIIMALSAVPLMRQGVVGIAIWALIVVVTLSVSVAIEKEKKRHHLKTYKQIVAFMDGRRLDEIEPVKNTYRSVLWVLGAALICAAVGIAVGIIMTHLK